jgi:hypothetical protein
MSELKSEYFKDQTAMDRAKFMHPQLHKIMEEMIDWLLEKGIHPVVTETVTTLIEDTQRKRVSSTHREGRAFDLRTRDWPAEIVKEFETHFENKYGTLGAVGSTTLTAHLLVYHDTGLGMHFHVQLSRAYTVANIKLPKVA